VILAGENESSYFQGRYIQTELKEKDIKHFVEKFVTKYYVWDDLNPELIIKDIEPLITDGLKETILTDLKFRKEKAFFGKKIQQSVAGVSVKVTMGETIVIFDVVMRVEGIPLIVSNQVALQMVKGIQTEWNPMGLYVNSITTHEGR
jgi:hypothetical protein